MLHSAAVQKRADIFISSDIGDIRWRRLSQRWRAEDNVVSASGVVILIRFSPFELACRTISSGVFITWATGSRNLLVFNNALDTFTRHQCDSTILSTVWQRPILTLSVAKFCRHHLVGHYLHHCNHVAITVQLLVIRTAGHHCGQPIHGNIWSALNGIPYITGPDGFQHFSPRVFPRLGTSLIQRHPPACSEYSIFPDLALYVTPFTSWSLRTS